MFWNWGHVTIWHNLPSVHLFCPPKLLHPHGHHQCSNWLYETLNDAHGDGDDVGDGGNDLPFSFFTRKKSFLGPGEKCRVARVPLLRDRLNRRFDRSIFSVTSPMMDIFVGYLAMGRGSRIKHPAYGDLKRE